MNLLRNHLKQFITPIIMMIIDSSLHYAQLKGIKESAFGRQPTMNKILFCFCCVLMFVTTVASSLYLYFSALCQVQPLIARKFKSCDVLSRKQILSLDRKIRIKSPDHLFGLNFFDSVLYIIVFRASVLSFFDLSCRSIPNRSITTCCSVFHRFCPVLPFLHFANLELAFSLQKPFGNLEKQQNFKNILISSKV